MKNSNGNHGNIKQPLRLTLFGFFVGLVGWVVGMIGRGDANSTYVQAGTVIIPFGVVIFLIGFFWLLIIYLEHWEHDDN